MQLKLKKLQGIVKEAANKEKAAYKLMVEVIDVFGPSVDVSNEPRQVFAAANDQLSIIESRGEDLPSGGLRVSTLLAAISTGREARKLAARLLPEKYAIKLLSDTDTVVRCAIAKRLTYKQLKEAIRRFPGDDALTSIARKKCIFEAGIPTPKSEDAHFNIYSDNTLHEVLDGYEPEDLTDGWYKRMALSMYSDYNGRADGNWQHLAISRLCSSIYATSGVKVDAMKLREMLDEICENSGCLKENFSLDNLRDKLMLESVGEETRVIPILDENFFIDPVKDLLRESMSSIIDSANKLFSITHDIIEESLISGDVQSIEVPQYGKLPRDYQWNSTAEKALDRYVSSWNNRAVARCSNARLVWNYGFNTKINFTLADK